MAPSLRVVLCLSMLALCLAAPKTKDVRWCVKSENERKKCEQLRNDCKIPDIGLRCISKSTAEECFESIKNGDADAICVDGGDIYKASLKPYSLTPIIAENYGSEKDKNTCYNAVAVVKKSSTFKFSELKDKKTCHTGIDKSAGWYSIIGLLLQKKMLSWAGPDIESVQKAASEFFKASCVPGATEPKLCKLCIGKEKNNCARNTNEPYYNYDGAFRCLQDGKGEVAFVKETTVPDKYKKDYELLCPDDTRKPISEFESCNLAKVPSHAVVARMNDAKTPDIIQYLSKAQEKKCNLFSSSFGNNLIFKDATKSLVGLPREMDARGYLGNMFYNDLQALKHDETNKIRWCTQSKDEKTKCDTWTAVSGGAIECTEGFSAENCIKQIIRGEADAVTLDGGYQYTAGKCGLVPVMGEYYDKDNDKPCKSSKSRTPGVYYAVAVVKKSNKEISWDNLKGKQSCHTALGRTAGWNIPVGLIVNKTQNCDMSTFFSKSCAPGADVNSNLCQLCIGNPNKPLEKTKCSPNDMEAYYGYIGALRCLVEKGDVGFMKESTVIDNTDGKNSADWAKQLRSNQFELLCPDNTRAPISDYKRCHLAMVPGHAVVTRPERRNVVVQILVNQQDLFGRGKMQSDMFQMFGPSGSSGVRDLIFKDSTQCLIVIDPKVTMKEHLGEEYSSAVESLSTCSIKSELLAACTFHKC
ncbi:serotransferrin-B-like isoform 2-T2 [Pelodytes ibericus]